MELNIAQNINPAIKIRQLCGGYNNVQLLKNINIDILIGQFTAIAGANGAGKTTLLKYLIREKTAPNQSIFIDGIDINKYSQQELAKKIGFLSQHSLLNQDFTVREAVSFGRYCHGDEKSKADFIDLCIDKVGLSYIANKYVTQISGGEFQLAMLARVLCQETPIIILDEPINNLDPKHQLKILNILKQQTLEGKTVLAVLHDLTTILNYTDNTIFMKNGEIAFSGQTNQVVTPQIIKEVYQVDCLISLSHDRLPVAVCYSL